MPEKETDEKKPSVSEKEEVKKASNAEKEGVNGKTSHGESSTTKHSKLPPICLRVDPLPRKKSRNGSSRSPSPPTRNDADKAKKDVKEAQSQNLEPKQSDTNKHITVSELKEKLPDEAKKGMELSSDTVQASSTSKDGQKEEVPTSKDDQEVQASSTSIKAQETSPVKSLQGGSTQENAGAESLQGGDKSRNDDDEIKVQSEASKDYARLCRIDLSEPDAAVRIQSAYRGYDVRRWQPLDKLRKIRDVHEQMQGVSRQLESLEASSKKPTEKEQVAIGETIMNLLLKLDTIQGLHPSVREARKSVARELICLQEKLDSLCKQPSGESNCTSSNNEELERARSVIQTVAPTSTVEASVEEDARRLYEEPSSMESMKLCDTAPSDVSKELRQVADPNEQKHQIEESSATTMEEAPDEGKAAAQVEQQGASLMDITSDEVLLGCSTSEKHQIEESNGIAKEAPEEDKAARRSDELEARLVDSMEPLHDAASSGDSSELKQCTDSTEQILHAEELNAWVSPAATEDNCTAAMSTSSVENVDATDKDGPIEGQVQEAAVVETLELNNKISRAEEDQQKESSAADAHLEDSSVPLKDAKPHQYDPLLSIDSVMSNVDDQPEEARDINVQEQVADITQDSTKEPDGTPEASTNDIEFVASADVEKPLQAPLLEPTSESDSATEPTVHSDVSGTDDSPHMDQKNEVTVDHLTVVSANGDEPLLEATRKEPNIQEGHPNLAEEADDTRAETILPELDPCELSCAHEMKVSSESQTDSQNDHVCLDSSSTDVQASETDECTKTLKEALVGATGADSAEEIGVQVPEAGECNESWNHAPTSDSAEEEADNPKKEDMRMQTETKASEEAFSASATPGSLKDNDEKRLAQENRKLKELLQKILASGNDQMGVITDLSEKVKVLERKLARKKRPKVRVHRPARHATAKVH
uniref:BAG domain-containing protein n=1 Tax=Arundo donax TaxID=35708 RepID=A0A0A8ZMB3_ARUDO